MASLRTGMKGPEEVRVLSDRKRSEESTGRSKSSYLEASESSGTEQKILKATLEK